MKTTRKAYISIEAHPLLIDYLEQQGCEICYVSDRVGSPIGSHPDLYYCQMGFTEEVFMGNSGKVGVSYPDDSIYNGACTGKFFIHNTEITDEKLLETVKKAGISIIDVKQGYAKCNCVIVDENSIITSDAGIAKSIEKYSSETSANCPDVLLISQGHVSLPGFKYGFIGGASGRIDDEIIFHGDLSSHPDFKAIKDFICTRGLSIKYFSEFPLTDLGSIIVV